MHKIQNNFNVYLQFQAFFGQKNTLILLCEQLFWKWNILVNWFFNLESLCFPDHIQILKICGTDASTIANQNSQCLKHYEV